MTVMCLMVALLTVVANADGRDAHRPSTPDGQVAHRPGVVRIQKEIASILDAPVVATYFMTEAERKEIGPVLA